VPKAFQGKFCVEVKASLGPFETTVPEKWHTVAASEDSGPRFQRADVFAPP